MLKLKPATQLINGQQTPCYAITADGCAIRDVPALQYDYWLSVVRKANAVLDGMGWDGKLTDSAKRVLGCA